MPCGKRPLVKMWDKPRIIANVKPSKYEQKEASVKLHWRNVIRNLEASRKEDNFWETQTENVKELVDPIIFERLRKIFYLPKDEQKYTVSSREGSLVPSEKIWHTKENVEVRNEREKDDKYSLSDYGLSVGTINVETVHEDSTTTDDDQLSKYHSRHSTKSVPKSMSVFLKRPSSISHPTSVIFSKRQDDSLDNSASSNDDMEVQVPIKHKHPHIKNVHYHLLYCSKSETDMISWKSKYRQKTNNISSSEEYNKKAEITTRKIASEFYEWWTTMGSIDYKSEIRTPENIEELFQVWFDEHASRSLVVDPKIVPCVLKEVAEAVGCPKSSCPNVLNKHISLDIKAEQSPPHIAAFGTSLPHKKKHIPPNNETEKTWHGVKINESLRSMACVWEDISHLTSTKSYYKWLMKHPASQIPSVFEDLYGERQTGRRRSSFIVPSDLVLTQGHSSTSSTQQLQLPVSQFNIDMKDVLEKLRAEM